MDITFLNSLNAELKTFLDKQGFSLTEEGIFVSDTKKIKAEYNDATSQFSLFVAEIGEGDIESDFDELSSWYFDEKNHGPNDIKVIAEDFVSIISANLGIVTKSSVKSGDIAMPTKAITGQTPGIDAFTNKFLSSFPQYKETYKAHVAKYGKFLPVEFYKTYGVEKCREIIDSKNKKAISKHLTMLGDMYVEGDNTVGNIVCAVIIAGTFKGNVAEFDAIAEEYLKDNIHLKQAGRAIIKEYSRNSKFRAVLD